MSEPQWIIVERSNGQPIIVDGKTILVESPHAIPARERARAYLNARPELVDVIEAAPYTPNGVRRHIVLSTIVTAVPAETVARSPHRRPKARGRHAG